LRTPGAESVEQQLEPSLEHRVLVAPRPNGWRHRTRGARILLLLEGGAHRVVEDGDDADQRVAL